MRAGVAGGALALIATAWALTGVYEVGANETGVVTRFGAFVGEAGPGLHVHLPAPIERVRRFAIGAQPLLDVASGDEAGSPGPMLTRDAQLANVDFGVRWRVTDPYRYLFRSAEPQAFLRHAAESAMREAVSQTSFIDLTAPGHGGAAARAGALLQASLRHDDIGVAAEGLLIRDAEPPALAQAGFHDMASAREDAQIGARDVGAYRERVLAAARGDAAKLVQAAQGSRDQEISGAKGEAARFALVDAQYRKAPDVTRERLYTEMMERVLHNTNKVIVQTPKGAGGQIVLPAELFHSKAADAPGQAAASQGQPPAGQAQGQAVQASGQTPAGAQPGPTA